jgi:hypothetical protein
VKPVIKFLCDDKNMRIENLVENFDM